MTITYVLESLENYDPTWVTGLDSNTIPFANGLQDKVNVGVRFDAVRRKILYAMFMYDANPETNTSGHTWWSGLTVINNGDSYAANEQRAQYSAEKDIDTGAVVFYNNFDDTKLVPAGIGPTAIGFLSFNTNPSNGDDIVLNGVTWTFVAAGAVGPQTNIQADILSTVTQLSWDLSASVDAALTPAYYTAGNRRSTLGTYCLGVTYRVGGVGGNAYTLGLGTAASARSGATLTGGDTASDGTWRRFVESESSSTDADPLIVDPRTGNIWQHTNSSALSCAIYFFRRSDNFAQVISPYQPPPGQGAHMELLGISADWTYIRLEQGHQDNFNTLTLTPRDISAEETTLDSIVPYAQFVYDPLWNTSYFRTVFDHSTAMFTYGGQKTGARDFKLYQFDEPSSAPFGGPTVGGGFTDITPWAGGTGPNSNVAAWTVDGKVATPSTGLDNKYLLYYLPNTNELACINKLWAGDTVAGWADPTGTRFDCTYVDITGGTFDYQEGFVTGYMKADWTTTVVAADAAWVVLNVREMNLYLGENTYNFPGVDYTKRWFFFDVQPVVAGVWTPDTSTYFSILAQYQFISGAPPVLLQFVEETPWDAAYPAYAATIGNSNVVYNSIGFVSQSDQIYNSGIADGDSVFIWDGFDRDNNTVNLNPSYLPDRANYILSNSCVGPFVRLRLVSPAPPLGRRWIAEMGPVFSAPPGPPPVSAAAGAIYLNVDVAGQGGSAGVSAGQIDLVIGVAGATGTGGAGAGQINLDIAVTGVGHGGSPGGLLKTITLPNTSGTPTAPFSHPPMLNLLFKEGDLPAGTYPVLQTAGGVNVPYSHYPRADWPDGSIRDLPVVLRFPDAVPGNGSADLRVYPGGGAQVPSGRTDAEIWAENFTVVGTGGLDYIAGTWTCDLQLANVVEKVVLADGPAGRVLRFLCNFNQAGSPHGQITTYFFLQQLQDQSGNLAGWRVLSRSTQPYFNYDTPPKNFRSFTSLVLKHGATVFDPMANSYSAKTFTWGNAGQANDIINSPGYGYPGGVAVRLTTTGTLPAGLALNTTYWVFSNSANDLYFVDGSAVGNFNNGVNRIHVTGAGAGVHTMTPIPYVCHFCSYWGATTEGKFVYFQGAGSVAAEATLRVQADKVYDHSTRIYPPWDMSIGAVPSNASYNWSPYTAGPLLLFIGTTGEREDIAPINSYHVRHFYTQAAVDEKLMRVIGLAQGMLSTCQRDHVTLGLINIGAGAYAGMPANGATTMQYRPTSSACSGFTAPAGNGNPYPGAFWTQCFNGVDPSHLTQYAAYPYMVTGEPQYLDLLCEMANAGMLTAPPVDRNFTVSAVTYNNIGPAGKDSIRTGAWSYRDMVWAAALVPTVHPDGSGLSAYLRDNAARQSTYMVAFNATNSVWWQTVGFWFPQDMQNGRASWQDGYLWTSSLIHANALGDANALSMCTHFSKWPPHVRATFGGNAWHLGTYYERAGANAGVQMAPVITSDAAWGATMDFTAGLSWNSGTSFFTISGPNFTPSNGDKYIFWNSQKPGGLALVTPYYAVNTSGLTFQLSLTPGGAPLAITDTASMGGMNNVMFVAANPPATNFVASGAGTSGYGANQLMGINWSLASGIATGGLLAASNDVAARQAAVNYTVDPKYCMGKTF